MIIAIDFDGTIVEHNYPKIGKLVPGAIDVLKSLIQEGHKLILYTMRSGEKLEEAVTFLRKQGIIFWGTNHNREQYIWTTSPKVYANIYIDDAALGVPLIYPTGKRPYVDWYRVGMLIYKLQSGDNLHTKDEIILPKICKCGKRCKDEDN